MTGFLMSFVHAGRGLVFGVRGGRNMQVMLAVAVCALVAGLTLGIDAGQWCAVTIVMGLVLAVELVNTAGEGLVDILCPEHDPRYGRVKDLLAAASLIAAIAAAIVGMVVFLPLVLERI